MNKFFLMPALLASSLARVAVAAPPAKPAATSLPREVRAQMPPGARSRRLISLPGGKGAPCLVHIWSVARPPGPQAQGGLSLYAVDLFGPGARGGPWRLERTASFVSFGDYGASSSAPIEASARWLKPAQNVGVVVLVRFSGPGGNNFTVVTFPDNVDTWFEVTPSVVQEFRVGGSGGATTSSLYLGQDARGTTTVVVKIIPHSNNPTEFLVAPWNGHRFDLPAYR